MNRRIFLQRLAAANCLAAMGWPLASAQAGEALDSSPVSDRITLITGAGGNVVMYQGDDGVTLIDCGYQERASDLLDLISELSGNAPVKRLFNTHWHEDHTGGNEAVHALGAQIIAHENTKLWLGADFDVEWRHWSHKPRPPEAMPDMTFYTGGEMDLGGETVQYPHYPRAHTDGDIALYFPDSNVLVAGGLLSSYRYPITDIATGGWIGGLIDANEAMLSMLKEVDDETVIIPDRGQPLGKADLQAQYDMLADLYEKMKTLARKGFSGHNMLENGLTADYDAVWGDPKEFVLETYRGMWAHTYDMGGFI